MSRIGVDCHHTCYGGLDTSPEGRRPLLAQRDAPKTQGCRSELDMDTSVMLHLALLSHHPPLLFQSIHTCLLSPRYGA